MAEEARFGEERKVNGNAMARADYATRLLTFSVMLRRSGVVRCGSKGSQLVLAVKIIISAVYVTELSVGERTFLFPRHHPCLLEIKGSQSPTLN
jgi:hypothetical protein